MISLLELESIVSLVGIYIILTLALNIITGMTGLLQLGHAGFYAIGAYAAGLTSIYFTIPELGFFNLFISFAVAGIAGATAAFLVGFPFLRLRGDYLAIATLGFGEITRLVLTNVEFSGGKMFADEPIGGSLGIAFTEFPDEVWANYPNYSAEYASWYVILICAIITYILLLNIKRSSFGRAMMCIREDEIAAQSMGINVSKYKILAFVISGVVAALAGTLFFHKELMIDPGNFSLMTSIIILLMLTLGGLGSLSGAILGAIILGIIPFILRYLNCGEYQQLIYAVMLILIIRLRPNGILGMKEFSELLNKKKTS